MTAPAKAAPMREDVTQAQETVAKMIEGRKSRLRSCERMLELLQPEWDLFKDRINHDVYVARDYAAHTSAARTHREEIDALEAILAHTARPDAEVTTLKARVAELEGILQEIGDLHRYLLNHPDHCKCATKGAAS